MSATYRSDDPISARRSQAARIGWRRRKATARLRLDRAVARVIADWAAGRIEATDQVGQSLHDLDDAYRHRHG